MNPSKIGMGLTVFARVWLSGQAAATVDRFTKRVKQLPEVVRVSSNGWRLHFLLRIVAPSLDAYRQFQIDHHTIEGVQSVKTEIPMQRIKMSSEMPLPKHVTDRR